MDVKLTGTGGNVPQADISVEFHKSRERATEIAAEHQKKVRQEQIAKEEAERQQKNIEVDLSKFVMSEQDMKELLLMMGSRGKVDAIEKMVELIKKEREIADKAL